MTDLIDYKSKILRTPSEKFNFSNPQTDPISLYNDLGNSMIENKGIGLSACQIGIALKAFVLASNPIQPFFNPIIVDKSEDTLILEEGCLTFPGLVVKIKRPQVIKVRFADARGEIQTRVFQDLTARVIQHEMDHLDGILFTQRCSILKLEFALKKAKKRGFEYKLEDLI